MFQNELNNMGEILYSIKKGLALQRLYHGKSMKQTQSVFYESGGTFIAFCIKCAVKIDTLLAKLFFAFNFQNNVIFLFVHIIHG